MIVERSYYCLLINFSLKQWNYRDVVAHRAEVRQSALVQIQYLSSLRRTLNSWMGCHWEWYYSVSWPPRRGRGIISQNGQNVHQNKEKTLPHKLDSIYPKSYWLDYSRNIMNVMETVLQGKEFNEKFHYWTFWVFQGTVKRYFGNICPDSIDVSLGRRFLKYCQAR
jgi:hypothetical protein